MDAIEIQVVAGPVSGRVRPPGSKSLTNRALVAAALAEGKSRLAGVLRSEDTQVMIDSLIRLGIAVQSDPASRALDVFGCGGRLPASKAQLYIANSGTTVRFLTALAALGHGEYRLDGALRMRQRPIQDLLDALATLGVNARSESGNGCPPVIVHAAGLPGGQAVVRGDISSQFLSGLLLAAPYAEQPVELMVDGPLVSQPYVRMTLAVMRAFGIAVDETDLSHFSVPQGHYQASEYAIEPDASAASYFFAAAAVTGGRVTVDGLSRGSLQGDLAFCECLAQMGCGVEYQAAATSVVGRPLRGIDVDMNAISDTVQTLAAVALFAEGPTTIRNVAHIRHKETDRIGNLAAELRKLGATVDELPDGLRIVPGPPQGAQLETYNDHRMAMSLAIAGLRIPGVVILDPRATEKTYPEFFRDLSALTNNGLNDSRAGK
jgi:3-phosphoshikimate 1-carboxyvinyltransferase